MRAVCLSLAAVVASMLLLAASRHLEQTSTEQQQERQPMKPLHLELDDNEMLVRNGRIGNRRDGGQPWINDEPVLAETMEQRAEAGTGDTKGVWPPEADEPWPIGKMGADSPRYSGPGQWAEGGFPTVERNDEKEGKWPQELLDELDLCHARWLETLARSQSGVIIECMLIIGFSDVAPSHQIKTKTLQMVKDELMKCGSGALFSRDERVLCVTAMGLLKVYHHIDDSKREEENDRKVPEFDGTEYAMDDEDDIEGDDEPETEGRTPECDGGECGEDDEDCRRLQRKCVQFWPDLDDDEEIFTRDRDTRAFA